MKTLHVDLAQRSYPIMIGQDLLGSGELKNHIQGKEVLVVSNKTIGPLFMDKVLSELEGFTVETFLLPDGEAHKNIMHFEKIISALLRANFHRQCTVVALGGGVIGDMAGFAAATYMRGVHFIQVPTSLLSQVDSSVGGKTGINHDFGKNMIGAFYQPKAVLIDVNTLKSLPEDQFRSGMAEVIKHGLIQDASYFEFLIDHVDQIKQKDPDILIQMIEKSCDIKARVVAQDEREFGIRAILNFGHTLGHAVESASGYKVLHGDSVFIGMRYALDLSVNHAGLDPQVRAKALRLFDAFDAPVKVPDHLIQLDVLSHMMKDKKFTDTMKFILLEAVGQPKIVTDLAIADIRKVLEAA